jgi:hypothetical protein
LPSRLRSALGSRREGRCGSVSGRCVRKASSRRLPPSDTCPRDSEKCSFRVGQPNVTRARRLERAQFMDSPSEPVRLGLRIGLMTARMVHRPKVLQNLLRWCAMETGSRAHLAGSKGGGGGNAATGRRGGSVGCAALALGRFADVTGALRPLQRPAQPLRRRCCAAQLPARQRAVGFLP